MRRQMLSLRWSMWGRGGASAATGASKVLGETGEAGLPQLRAP